LSRLILRHAQNRPFKGAEREAESTSRVALFMGFGLEEGKPMGNGMEVAGIELVPERHNPLSLSVRRA